MKKVYFNKQQLEECILLEIALNGDENLATTKDPKQAAQKTIDAAQQQGVDVNNGVNVTFSADSLRKNAGIQEGISKKDIKKAKAQFLKEHSVKMTKQDFLKGNGK